MRLRRPEIIVVERREEPGRELRGFDSDGLDGGVLHVRAFRLSFLL